MRLRFLALLAALAGTPLLTACDDNSFLGELVLSADTATIGLPGSAQGSALDLVRATSGARLIRRPERVEDSEQWDVSLRRAESGALVLRPFDPSASQTGGAGIAAAPANFDAIDEAPRGTSNYSQEDVPATPNAVYFVRSRAFSGVCYKYAKLKVLEADPAAGTVRLAMVINEGCDDERLADD